MKRKAKIVFMIAISCFLVLTSFNFPRQAFGETSGFTKVQAGSQHTMALDSYGNIWSWGVNQFGQIGDGTANVRPYAVKVKEISGVKEISAGGMSSAAVKNDGTVWTWGSNYEGQLGDGTNTDRYLPVQVKGLTNIVSISAGGSHMLALKDDGTVWAWGLNDSGQLGAASGSGLSLAPVQVQGLSGIIAVSAGGFHSLALRNDGTVWSFGDNDSGQLGIAGVYKSQTPVQVPGLKDIKSISAGWYFSTALSDDGKVWTWGENVCGQLGDGTTENKYKPVQVPGLDHVTAVAASIRSTMALQDNGTVWVWGNNWAKRDPSNTFLGYELILSPAPVPGLTNISGLSTGGSYFTVLTSDGKILSWGINGGRLGNGLSEDQAAPGSIVDSVIFDSIRLSGEDRIGTAIAVSKKMMPVDHSTGSVLLATSEDFPDALVGASLGVLKDAPLLLVSPDGDNQRTIGELTRVLKQGGNICILGGTGVVSADFEAKLKSLPGGYSIQRLAGKDRYDTAAQIDGQVKTQQGGEVIIATGEDFPDSLSVSSYASANSVPIVLVETKNIPEKVLNYLNSVKPQLITIVGGEGVVSSSIEDKLKGLFPGAGIRRLGGIDRYETSAIVAKTLFGNNSSNIFVATGVNFPDALAGSIFAGSTISPIILVDPNNVPDVIKEQYLDSLSDKNVVTLGGQGAVSESVVSGLESALK